jgi:hypothetical protein
MVFIYYDCDGQRRGIVKGIMTAVITITKI